MTTESNSEPTEIKKKFKVGVPRALYFYKYFPFWEEMLKRLGCEIIVSPETNKKILKMGSDFASGELCVPIKIFFGHVLYLDQNHPDLDFIFVPRYVSLNKHHYFCPKFLSLPDVVRNVIKPKIPVLEWEMNAKEKSNIESAIELAKQLGIDDQNMAGESYVQAINRFKAFKKEGEKGINYSELIYRKYPEYVGKKKKETRKAKDNKAENDIDKNFPINLLILGHPYNTYETIINQDLLERLKRFHANVVTLDQMPSEIYKKPVTINQKYRNYWNMEEELLQCARKFLLDGQDENGNNLIDGVIFLISFACGPDSLIQELIMRDFQKVKMPFLNLILDEHSGESGLVTRVESFIDMIRRTKYKDQLQD